MVSFLLFVRLVVSALRCPGRRVAISYCCQARVNDDIATALNARSKKRNQDKIHRNVTSQLTPACRVHRRAPRRPPRHPALRRKGRHQGLLEVPRRLGPGQVRSQVQDRLRRGERQAVSWLSFETSLLQASERTRRWATDQPPRW